MTTITLPWPPKELSPNARVHWSKKAKRTAQYRENAQWETYIELGERQAAFPVLAVVTFHPPDKRKRDIDNMLGSIKAGLDGIADMIGVDDSKWVMELRRGAPVKGGEVRVELSWEGAE